MLKLVEETSWNSHIKLVWSLLNKVPRVPKYPSTLIA